MEGFTMDAFEEIVGPDAMESLSDAPNEVSGGDEVDKYFIPDEEDDQNVDQDKIKDDVVDNDEVIDEDDEENDEDKDSQQNTSSTPFTDLMTTLGESLPYINPDEDTKITNAADLVEFMENKISTEVQNREFASLTDSQKVYLESIKSGVPHEVVAQDVNTLSSIDSITDDQLEYDSDLRESIIVEGYKASGVPEEKARKLAKYAIDSGSDIDEAKESLGTLKQSVQAKIDADKQAALKQVEDAQKAYEANVQKLKNTIDNPEEVLGEKNLTPKYKQELFNMINTPQEVNGQKVDFLTKMVRENPVEVMTKLAHLIKLTKGLDSKEIAKLRPSRTRSKVVKELDAKLKNLDSALFVSDNETNFSDDNNTASGGINDFQPGW